MKNWFLHFNSTQHGPFAKQEIQDLLKAGKITAQVYAWKDGMSDWIRLEQIVEFELGNAKTEASNSKIDARQHPRKPLLARVMATNQKAISVGICRDISMGGMQVLTAEIPGQVGSLIKLNISPPDLIQPFVASGKIVRLLEDGRGYSFKFEELDSNARDAIRKYSA